MRKVSLLLFITTCTLLSGCFETTEDVSINTNGSGTYTVDMDMSGLLSMMNMLKAADTVVQTGVKGKNIDSTILFSPFTDTATSLSAEDKALLRNASIHIKMNEQVFKIKMTYPFEKVADMAKLMALTGSASGGNMIKKMLGNNAELPDENNGNVSAGMLNYKDLYQMTYGDGLLERKIREEKFTEFGAKNNLNEMAQLEDMMDAIKMNNVLHLPRAAKTVQGAKATLSADKKTVTISCTLKELIANPKVSDYRIEY